LSAQRNTGAADADVLSSYVVLTLNAILTVADKQAHAVDENGDSAATTGP
jgi:hypothetical protein